MSTKEFCARYGVTISQVAEYNEVCNKTIKNWYEDSRKRLETAILGTRAQLNMPVLPPPKIQPESPTKKATKAASKKRIKVVDTDAESVIKFYVKETGKIARCTSGNLKLVRAVLKDYTVEDCFLVIKFMTGRWLGDPKWDEFLCIKTLFKDINFDKYISAARADRDGKIRSETNGNQAHRPSTSEIRRQSARDRIQAMRERGTETAAGAIEGECYTISG